MARGRNRKLIKTKDEIKERLAEFKADERYSYPPAQVHINAPLALIQCQLRAMVYILEWVLGPDEGGESDEINR
jgi:hypothetical protein